MGDVKKAARDSLPRSSAFGFGLVQCHEQAIHLRVERPARLCVLVVIGIAHDRFNLEVDVIDVDASGFLVVIGVGPRSALR